jgi:hypothetical protein
VLENCILDILELSGRELLRKIKWFEAILFITSPNRVTEYHLDREVSWILQIQGDKEIHLFDRADKDIVPDAELETYWTADNRAARYKPEFESRAMIYNMRPGSGVHIPINSPHWLKNKNNISVTLNVNFQFHDQDWANLYKANYYLRRAGITPQRAGVHPVADRLKSMAFTAVQRAKQTVKGRPHIPAGGARAEPENRGAGRAALMAAGSGLAGSLHVRRVLLPRSLSAAAHGDRSVLRERYGPRNGCGSGASRRAVDPK